jgi:hypothetical protein
MWSVRSLLFTDISEVLAASIVRVIALMMEAASTSEKLADFHQITQCRSLGDSNLYFCYGEYIMKYKR